MQTPPEATRSSWVERLGQRAPVRRALVLYRRHERYAPMLFFFGGVAWDATTLRRIDTWFDNLFLLVYLVLVGGLVLVTVMVEAGRFRWPMVVKYREWLPAGIQFFLGALFSAYVVFYVQSASLSETSFFLVLLVGLLVANEFIHRRFVNLYLLFSLYFLAAFSFFIFFIPVLVKEVSYLTFAGGGLLSLGLVGGMLAFLRRQGVFEHGRQFVAALGLMLGLFGVLNLFYLQNWIPPVPLALRHAGIYHHVSRQDGAVALGFERPAWYRFWVDSDERFRYAPGDTVYCFAAVFAPTKLTKRIYHEWRYYDEAKRAWVTTDRMPPQRVVGGRDAGWRGHTYKRNVRPGRWRVDVKTEEGRILGRIRFTIEETDLPVAVFKWIRYE